MCTGQIVAEGLQNVEAEGSIAICREFESKSIAVGAATVSGSVKVAGSINRQAVRWDGSVSSIIDKRVNYIPHPSAIFTLRQLINRTRISLSALLSDTVNIACSIQDYASDGVFAVRTFEVVDDDLFPQSALHG